MDEESKLYLLLGEMKGMLSSALAGLEDVRQEHKELELRTIDRMNAQSARLGKVEQFQWKIAGIVAAATLIVPAALTVIQIYMMK